MFALANREWQDVGAKGLAKMVGGSNEEYTGWDKRSGRGRGGKGLLTPLFILRARASASFHPVRPLYARFRGQNLRNVRGWNPFIRFFNCKKDPPGSRGEKRGRSSCRAQTRSPDLKSGLRLLQARERRVFRAVVKRRRISHERTKSYIRFSTFILGSFFTNNYL